MRVDAIGLDDREIMLIDVQIKLSEAGQVDDPEEVRFARLNSSLQSSGVIHQRSLGHGLRPIPWADVDFDIVRDQVRCLIMIAVTESQD